MSASATGERRWRFAGLRRRLIPPNGVPLFRWLDAQARAMRGTVVNVGAGQDARQYGDRVVAVDAFAPRCSVRADFTHALPFRDAVFDGAVCTEVLEHVPDMRQLLSEIHRVLKPGGRFVATVPFVFHYHPDPLDFRRLTPVGLRSELEQAGFEVEFLAGIGNRLTAFALILDSMNTAIKLALRSIVFVLAPFIGGSPRHGVWSAWSAHVVSVSRKIG